MKKWVQYMLAGMMVLCMVSTVAAADPRSGSDRITQMETRMKMLAASLSEMKSGMNNMDRRISKVVDMEERLAKMESDVQYMRQKYSAPGSRARQILVPATW